MHPKAQPPPVARRNAPSRTHQILAVVLFTLIVVAYLNSGSCKSERQVALDTSPWAQYSPYVSVAVYIPPPGGCRVDQVNIIQRHGARYPTLGAGLNIQAAVDRLKRAKEYRDPRLQFVKDWNYTLGVNDLVPIGNIQSCESGGEAFQRYGKALGGNAVPFVRASDSERVIISALNWTQGFSDASHGILHPQVSVIIPETGNNTLDAGMCPSAGKGTPQIKAWQDIWAPSIRIRLNEAARGADLTDADVYSLVSLCAFDSVARASKSVMTQEETSPFCALFTQEEFKAYGYSGDLNKFYGTGYGQDLGRVQGVGYVNELLARLTNKPVQDNTQTNRTLDSSPETFPLGRKIYVDFSHDNQMIAIYTALGLFRQPEGKWLDPTKPDVLRTWVVSRMTPFSARMVVERLDCEGKEFVRTLVNDAVQPMDFCVGAKRDGLCELEAFVESQIYSRENGQGDFERCFA